MSAALAGLRRPIEVRPFDAPLGAEIVGFPFADWTEADLDQVRAAWARYLVLRFPQTGLDDVAHIRFSAAFGPPVIHPRQLQQGALAGHPEILSISNMKKADGSPAGDLGDGEVLWHTDTWFKPKPPAGSFLRALKIPPTGGDTHFMDMIAVYESLPGALKAAIAGRAIHHQTVYDGRGDVRMGMSVPENPDPRTWPGVDHPIARRHLPSGCTALFLGGRRLATIVGLPPDESDAILAALWEQVAAERFTWTQLWRVDDMVCWDNRATLHRRDAFDPAATRLMHRTTAEGEIPVPADGPAVA